MRHYSIYLVQDEVAHSYFGKEAKLYQLFLENHKAQDVVRKQQLEKQVAYITKRMPVFQIEQAIDEQLSPSRGYRMNDREHQLVSSDGHSFAKLLIKNEVLVMEASGGFSAETAFFEVLRQVDASFLAVEYFQYRFGWLKPVKTAHLI